VSRKAADPTSGWQPHSQPLFLFVLETAMPDLVEFLAVPVEIFEDSIDAWLNHLSLGLREKWNRTTKGIA
jgi:hypothetical protein